MRVSTGWPSMRHWTDVHAGAGVGGRDVIVTGSCASRPGPSGSCRSAPCVSLLSVMSIVDVSVRQRGGVAGEVDHARLERVRAVAGDGRLRSPEAPDWTAPPSTRHSTWLMPECASVPVTDTVYGFGDRTGRASVVVLIGGDRVDADVLRAPARGVAGDVDARASRACASPVPVTVACSGDAPRVTAPPLTRHWTSSRPGAAVGAGDHHARSRRAPGAVVGRRLVRRARCVSIWIVSCSSSRSRCRRRRGLGLERVVAVAGHGHGGGRGAGGRRAAVDRVDDLEDAGVRVGAGDG